MDSIKELVNVAVKGIQEKKGKGIRIIDLRDVDGGFEDMALANFLFITFGTCHVDFLLLPLAFGLRQTNILRAGVELRESVVVPQNTITLT